MSRVDSLTHGILHELFNEFVNQKRRLTELNEEYAGVPMATLKEKLCGDSAVHNVDFDLALKDLVDKKWVGTGPLTMVEFPQTPGIIVMPMLASKNEFAYLREKGYKAAQKTERTQNARQAGNNLHIWGGTFNQSPIGMGKQVTQSVTTIRTEAPVFLDLRRAVAESAIEPRDRTELLARIEAMENAHQTGGFSARYAEFIASAANRMTLVAPFIPVLTALLH